MNKNINFNFNCNNIFHKYIQKYSYYYHDVKEVNHNTVFNVEICDKDDFKKNYEMFEKNLAFKYECIISEFLSKKYKKIYKDFKKYLNIVAENTYAKIKGNVINHFIERPFIDIFDIAFNRYITSCTDFEKLCKHIFKRIITYEYDHFISFKYYNTNDIKDIDWFYMSLYRFRKIIDKAATNDEEVKYTPEVTEYSNDIILNIRTGKIPLTSYLKILIIKIIREYFKDSYIANLFSYKTDIYNKIATDIASFYMRNASSMNESLQKIIKQANDVLFNFRESIFNSIEYITQDNNATKDKEALFSTIGTNFVHIHQLISLIDSIARPSQLKQFDTSIDMEDLQNKFFVLCKDVTILVHLYGTSIVKPFLLDGYNDSKLIFTLTTGLKLIINNAIEYSTIRCQNDIRDDKTHLLEIKLIPEFDIGDDKTSFDNLIKEVLPNNEMYTKFMNDLKVKYGDLYNTELGPTLNIFIKLFKTHFMSIINDCNSICEIVDKWIKEKLIAKIDDYACFDPFKNIFYDFDDSCTSQKFITLENKTYFDFVTNRLNFPCFNK